MLCAAAYTNHLQTVIQCSHLGICGTSFSMLSVHIGLMDCVAAIKGVLLLLDLLLQATGCWQANQPGPGRSSPAADHGPSGQGYIEI